jgi:hypothetical protein
MPFTNKNVIWGFICWCNNISAAKVWQMLCNFLVSEPLSILFSKYEHFQKYIKESNISINDYAPCLPLGHCWALWKQLHGNICFYMHCGKLLNAFNQIYLSLKNIENVLWNALIYVVIVMKKWGIKLPHQNIFT